LPVGGSGSGPSQDTLAQRVSGLQQFWPAYLIARMVDLETGSRSTLVVNDDGSCHAFGLETIARLQTSSESAVDSWMKMLTSRQLQGLRHEIRQRLLEAVHLRIKQLAELSKKIHLDYLKLGEVATDRELDEAYGQLSELLSKPMHPDKNGNMEQSKRKIQGMKYHYEALKRGLDYEAGLHENSENEKPDGDKADDQAEEDQGEHEQIIEFDPFNHASLDHNLDVACKKMLQQLSTVPDRLFTAQ